MRGPVAQGPVAQGPIEQGPVEQGRSRHGTLMNNVLLYIGGLLVAVLSALFAVPHFIDWNGYRGVFEEEASRVLGREVRVGGAVNVRLLPVPYVRFEKVRVADATGGTGEPFFRAEAFTMWLSVPPLLGGVLVANEIELVKPRLKLQSDASGRGNWTTLSIAQASLPFIPAGISLQAVRISDGSIGIATAGGDDLQLGGINGELEAEALEGPYKFKGALMWRDTERQVRLATARPDADGGVRLKALVAAPQSGNSYVLDGRISDLGQRARFDGEIQGKLMLGGAAPGIGAAAAGILSPAQPGASAGPAAGPGNGGGGGGRPYLDLKAVVAADLTAARADQLAISVENVGQPQLVTGAARVAWTSSPALELALTSRWLDLDRLAGHDAADQPIDTAQALVSALLGQLPASGRVDARFAVEQTSLGGEAVSGLSLKLVRETGPLEIRELRAGLPGGTRLDITGTLAEGTASPELDGALNVRGSSLARFMAWAGKSRALAEGRTDGPFLVRGKLRLGAKTVALSDAAAELNGMPLMGDVRYELGERRRVALRLDGQSIDLSQLWPGALDWISAMVPMAASSGSSSTSPDADPAGRFDARSTDLTLQVRAAELVAGARTLRDVDADLAIEKGRLSIARLRLATSDGLDLDLEGELADATTRPKGTLRGLVAADRPAAVEGLLRAIGDAAAVDAAQSQIAALAPLRLAGRVSIGQRTPTATDVDADGTVQGGRLVASARLDAGWQRWRDGPASISMAADSPDVDQLLRFALSATAEPARGRTPRRGQVELKAQGVPGQGMLAAASLTSPGLVLSYDGPLKLEKGMPGAIDGEVRITADDVTEALELAGLRLGGGVAGLPVDGVLHVAARDNVLTLKPRELTIGTRRIAGNVILAQRTGRPSTVTADLELGEVTLPELLTPLLERRTQAAVMSQQAAAGGVESAAGPWPDLGFDLQPLDRLDGRIEVRFAGLRLKDQVALGPGRLVARLGPGRVDIETLEGAALGGQLSSSGSLARTKGGVDGTFAVRLAGLDPALVASTGAVQPAGAATVAIALDLEARATSPRGLVAGLKGKGRAEIAGLQVAGLTPAAVSALAQDFVAGRLEPGDDALSRALLASARETPVAMPSGSYPIEVADGALSLRQLAIIAPGGRTTIDTTVDLGELRFDSEWRIDHSARSAAAGTATVRAAPLPPVTMVYAGDLGRIGAVPPRISAGALERELAVRKMERDVEELERLRKEDERRRAADVERQRAIEAERARGAGAVVPGQSVPSTDSGAAQGQAPTQTQAPSGAQAAPQAKGIPQPSVSGAGEPAGVGGLPAAGVAPAPVTVAPAPSPQPGGATIRVVPAPRPVRRVSPADEIMRQLSPN